MKELKQKIDEYNNYSKEIRENLSQFMKSKIKHLTRLLRSGGDYRDDGISWIIKHLWLMGVRVKVCDLPDMVNIRIKNFIIEKARIELIIL